jgi:phage terminase large subunit-like protein
MKYTEEQIRQIAKAMDDIEYFAENFIKINHPVHGLTSIKLNDFQKQVIHDFTSKKIFFTPGPRQKGKTTIAAIILLHQALFHQYRVSLVFARTKVLSNTIIEIITNMYDNLPEFMQMSSLTTRNKSKIVFENSCSIISAGANTDHGRGRAVSNIYVDESEWFDKLDEVMTSLYPCMATIPYSKIFSLSSTFTGDTSRKYGLEAV